MATTTEIPYAFHNALVVSQRGMLESPGGRLSVSRGPSSLSDAEHAAGRWISQGVPVTEAGQGVHDVSSVQQVKTMHGNNDEGRQTNMKCVDSSFNGFRGYKDKVCVSEQSVTRQLSSQMCQSIKQDIRSDARLTPAVPLQVESSWKETRLIVGNKESPGYRSKMEDVTLIKPSVVEMKILSKFTDFRIPDSLTQTLSKATKQTTDRDDNQQLSLTNERFHLVGVFDGHGGIDVAQKLHDLMPEYIKRAVTTTVETESCTTNNTANRTSFEEQTHTDSFSEQENADLGIVLQPVAMDVDSNPFERRLAENRLSAANNDARGGNDTPVLSLSDLEDRIVSAFEQLNIDLPDSQEKTVGSTAVVSLISSRFVVVANVGDSRAVLRRNGMSFRVSRDQKPDEEDEEERIRECGGRIWDFNGRRVMGLLAMTRAFGDDCLKPFGICATPEVTILPRTEQDEFLILACDGLWDVISDEEACCLVQRCFKRAEEREASAMSACRVAASVLFRAAFAKGSNDNISVVVIDLRSNKDDPVAHDME